MRSLEESLDKASLAPMHDDQVHIDADVARHLIRTQFPQFREETIAPLATAGTMSAIFRIGSGWTARFPLRWVEAAQCAVLLEQETAAMEELAAVCPVATPRPVGIGDPGGGYPMPWFIQTWIDGDTATPHGLAGSQSFPLDLARLVLSLRTADVRGRRFDGRGRGGNLMDHDAWIETCFTNSAEFVDVDRLRPVWAQFRALPRSGPDVMSHKDLTPMNLLVRGERLVGVLDGGGFGPADPALDLVAGWHLLDRDRRAVFRDAVGSDELEWQRGAAWAFEQAIGLVWYYRESNPTMSALGDSTIARLLESFG